MNHSKIIIVGAGAAGIAAASKLVENNIYDFTILEAENRIGGRVCTSSIGGAVVDLGAQWVHGKVNNVVHKFGAEADQLSDCSYDVTKSICVAPCGSFLDDEVSWKLFCLFKEILNDRDKLLKFRGSLGDYFIENLNERCKDKKLAIEESVLQSFIEWFHRFQNSIDGSDSWFETSACGTLEYYECEGNLLTTWRNGGYYKMFDLIMGKNHKVIKERILFDKIVKTVNWEQKPPRLICSNGSSFTADHVLFTISLGALKESYKTLFVPALPSKKVQAIEDLGYGTVNKIFLKFPFRWWPLDCPGFNILHRKNSPSIAQEGPNWLNEVFAFFSVDSDPSVLCGWVVGSAGRAMELCTDQEVQQGCYQLLTNFLGHRYKIPFPECILRSQWYKKTNFRGSYSFRTVASDDSEVSAADLASPLYLSPDQPVILFAGEATHDHFYSTVHGAIETGWREAGRLISHINKTPNARVHENMDQNLECLRVPVVIIGAGMAGLGAGKTLMQAGIYKFIILEAQDYVGGRACSLKMNVFNQSTCFELGAQWIHGENNPLFELANAEGLLSNEVSVEGEGIFLKPNAEAIPDIIVQEVAQVVGNILEDCCKFVDEIDYKYPGSIGDILSDRFYEYLGKCNDSPQIHKIKMDLFDWHKRFQVIDNSCDDLSCLSAKSWGHYQYSGGNNYNNLREGYLSLIQRLTRDFPNGSIKTSSVVKQINLVSNESEVKVFCEDGTIYLTEHVIVTCSLGYLKENHQTLFSPSLPDDMIKAINSIGFGTINKLFLVYNYNWWPEGMKGIQLVWDTKEKEDSDHQSWLRHISGFDVVDNMTGVLLGWIGGEGARIMETLSDAAISNECTNIIRRFLNRPDIPVPLKIFRSNWYSNKFVRGAYSHMTKDCDTEGNGPENLSQPIYVNNKSNDYDKHPAILFAGEAVHKNYFSTTHGAYMSGRSQAQIVINYRNRNHV